MTRTELECVDYKIVYCVEAYSKKHHMKEQDTFKLIRSYNLPDVLREHTFTSCVMDEDEIVSFAEDFISARQKRRTI